MIYRKGADITYNIMSVCVSKIMSKVVIYTCRLRRYDYAHCANIELYEIIICCYMLYCHVTKT